MSRKSKAQTERDEIDGALEEITRLSAPAPSPDADFIGELVGQDSRPVVIYPIPEEKKSGDALEDDFDYSRNILKMALAQAALALNELSSLGQKSNHVRPYETLVALIGATSSATNQLINLHERKVKVKKADPEGDASTPKTVTNNIGEQTNILCTSAQSTADMLKALKQTETPPMPAVEEPEKDLEDTPF